MRVLTTTVLLTAFLLTGAALGIVSSPSSADAAMQQIDDDVPPGNPVVGSDRPGDLQQAGQTNYGLWAVVAGCLIAAGVLLVNVERWEARRIRHAEV